jgi:hypothetical protein
MVECHAVGHAPAAIVPGDREALVPKSTHDSDKGARHRALAVRLPYGIPITGQVGDHQREALGEARRHPMPGGARLRKAVQQEQRLALARAHQPDPRPFYGDRLLDETLIHGALGPPCA